MAKRDEKLCLNKDDLNSFTALTEQEKLDYNKKSKLVIILFSVVLLVIILASVIPDIADLGLSMVLMALTFVVGTIIIGNKFLGGFKNTLKSFVFVLLYSYEN